RHSNGGGDESSKSRWGSDRSGGGGFGREANRDLGPSRADEVDNWATSKKPSVAGNGFERRDRDRGGFFDSQSKADESESWVANKSFTPSEGRRFGMSGGFDRERRGGGGGAGFTSNGGGADSDFWGKKKEDSNGGGTVNESGRPRLNLQPRTLPISIVTSPGSGPAASTAKPKGSNPFGEARPREEVLAEKGQDWKKIDEQLDSMKIKEVGEKAEGGSSFGNRSFGIGNGRSSDHTEMSWRKPDTTEDDASSH
ncbi:eukaryotic translation initiation factor 4B3, partial [Morus notabilis]|uniref:eukaryotic translation initiation factor 4B3 n=1 Tax=Morus notabilis TaxID=981085 RepID=UPI000CED79F7